MSKKHPRRGRENRPAEKAALMTSALQLSGVELGSKTAPVDPDAHFTDAEILDRMQVRFDIIEKMTHGSIDGTVRATIVAGDPGLGKTYTIDHVVNERDPEKRNTTQNSGYAKATGLYRLLYEKRSEGQLIVIDDCDSIFFDEVSLSMLKAACDTTRERHISYLSEYKLLDDAGEPIPSTFQFDGAIMFITNLDFDKLIDAGHNLAPHLKALVSRCHYIDVGLRSRRAKLLRIEQVVKQGMLKGADHKGRSLTGDQQRDVMAYIRENAPKLREVSLRMAVKISDLIKSDARDWKRTADVTCLRV